MGLLFEKLKARQKPDGTFTPAPAEDTPMLSGSSLNVPRPEYPDKVEVEPVSHTTIQPQTIYDIVSQYGRPRSYEKEVAEAERQKKLGMLSDILGLGVNLATGVAGRRIFDQPQSNTSIADARLQRLKDLQRADSVRFDNALLNARLQDYQNERAASVAKANADWEKHKFDTNTKLLQKSEMRKNMVMDLIYRGFIYAANYSESHYNPRRSQIKTELRYLFVTTPNR